MKKIKLLLVDDHQMMVDMWSHLLGADERFSIVGVSTDGESALEMIRKHSPDIVLLDISLPDISGIDLAKTIRKKFVLTRILAVSMHTNILTIRRVMAAGAKGYISKTSSFEEMKNAILAVYDNKDYTSADVEAILSNPEKQESGDDLQQRINSLTKREMEIIEMIREGFSSHDIAEKLFISQRTVEVHRYNIFRKLNVANAISMMKLLNREVV